MSSAGSISIPGSIEVFQVFLGFQVMDVLGWQYSMEAQIKLFSPALHGKVIACAQDMMNPVQREFKSGPGRERERGLDI